MVLSSSTINLCVYGISDSSFRNRAVQQLCHCMFSILHHGVGTLIVWGSWADVEKCRWGGDGGGGKVGGFVGRAGTLNNSGEEEEIWIF